MSDTFAAGMFAGIISVLAIVIVGILFVPTPENNETCPHCGKLISRDQPESENQ